MKLTCNTPHDAELHRNIRTIPSAGLFGMDVILARKPRRVTPNRHHPPNGNATAGEDFHWLFRLELHTSITVSGARSETFAAFTMGIGLTSSYLGAVSWLRHIEVMARLIALAGLPRVGKSSVAWHLARRSYVATSRFNGSARTGPKARWRRAHHPSPSIRLDGGRPGALPTLWIAS